MNGYEKTTEPYKNEDFWLFCYLKDIGIPLATVEKEKSIAYFCFKKSPEIKRS